jgi:hypothetical protein
MDAPILAGQRRAAIGEAPLADQTAKKVAPAAVAKINPFQT